MENDTKAYGASAPVTHGTNESAGVGLDDEFERLYEDLERLCVRMSRQKFGIPEDDMKTIVHDVFISYLANQTVVHGNLRGYLIGAIWNQTHNYWRTKQSENRIFSSDDVQTLDDLGKVSADDFFDELSLGMDVLATLEKLSARCRVALTLCWNDAETDDIAEALNTTPDNVYNVLHRCRKRARDIYESLTQVS